VTDSQIIAATVTARFTAIAAAIRWGVRR